MNEHLKDRGTKKWTSIMLPEHVKALKQLLEEEKREQKPLLDEQHLMEMDRKLKDALFSETDVKIIVYRQFMKEKVIGKITAIREGYVYIQYYKGILKTPLDCILDIALID